LHVGTPNTDAYNAFPLSWFAMYEAYSSICELKQIPTPWNAEYLLPLRSSFLAVAIILLQAADYSKQGDVRVSLHTSKVRLLV